MCLLCGRVGVRQFQVGPFVFDITHNVMFRHYISIISLTECVRDFRIFFFGFP